MINYAISLLSFNIVTYETKPMMAKPSNIKHKSNSRPKEKNNCSKERLELSELTVTTKRTDRRTDGSRFRPKTAKLTKRVPNLNLLSIIVKTVWIELRISLKQVLRLQYESETSRHFGKI